MLLLEAHVSLTAIYTRVVLSRARREYTWRETHKERERDRERESISRNVSAHAPRCRMAVSGGNYACTWSRGFVPRTRTRGTKLHTVRQALIAYGGIVYTVNALGRQCSGMYAAGRNTHGEEEHDANIVRPFMVSQTPRVHLLLELLRFVSFTTGNDCY